MKRFAFGPAVLAALLSAGCTRVLSLQPLYSADDPIPAIDLVGRWAEVGGKSICTVSQTDGGLLLSYLPDEGRAARYRVRPVAVGNAMFLDLTSADDLPDFAISGHWLARVGHDGSDLEVWALDGEWVEKQCTAGRLTCFEVSEAKMDDLVITSPTAVLQKVLLDAEAFRDPGRFRKLD